MSRGLSDLKSFVQMPRKFGNSFSYIVIAFSLIGISTVEGNAQSNIAGRPRSLVRFSLGLGTSPGIFKTVGSGALDLGAIASYQRGNWIYSLRIIDVYDFNMVWGPAEYILDYSFLYGLSIIHGEMGYVSAGIGIGLVKGRRHGKTIGYEKFAVLPFEQIGMPLEVQAFVTTPYFGFGPYFFANINRSWNTYGWLFCLQFGKLQ